MALTACAVLRNHPNKLRLFIDFSNSSKQFAPSVVSRKLHGPPKVNEHSDVPLYPPIPQFKTKKENSAVQTKNFMANLGTVEEKQFHINRPKYYGWYSYMLQQGYIPCDAKEFLQFATQTTLIDGLPDYYNAKDDNVDKLIEELAPLIEQTILNQSLYTEKEYEVANDQLPFRDQFANNWAEGRQYKLKEKKEKALVRSIHQLVMGSLVGRVDHLGESSEDYDARNDAFWFRGGIGPDKSMLSKRKGTQDQQKKNNEKGYGTTVMDEAGLMQPYERALQYKGNNLIQLRSGEPLPPFIDRDDPLVTQSKVPISPHDPRIWGYKAETQHGTNVPGYWPDADHQHGLLCYLSRANSWNYQAVGKKSEENTKDQNSAKALLSCFGWLLPQACHLGFSPMTEMTFPLATQATVTDGKTWSYYAYQLNTTDLTTNEPEEHTHNNVMWVGEDQELFDRVENGKVVNFNPSSLAPLLKMYMLEPQTREYSLTPYLSHVKTLSNFHDSYQRQFLFDSLRRIYSNRPRHLAKPEIYLWEKIHLIDHPGVMSMRMGPRRRRWFQMAKISHLGREHWHPEFESLDEKNPRYIPKALRPHDFMRKKGLGRRYGKHMPKLNIPLEEKAAIYKLPKVAYEPPE